MNDSFGKRLAEERKRIGRTQPQLAALVGATKRSQIDWESDSASPKASYLAGFAAEGIDVQYLITGVRSKPVEDTLTPRQKALLANYDAADEAGKKFIESAAVRAVQPDHGRGTSIVQSNSAAGAVQVGFVGGNQKIRTGR